MGRSQSFDITEFCSGYTFIGLRMTDAKIADPAKSASLAQQIVKILAKESSENRKRAISAVLTLLGEEVSSTPGKMRDSDLGDGEQHHDLGAFFTRDEKLKPSDHAFLCAAYHYSQYGMLPFSLDDLRQIASHAGVVIPDRLDMTLKNATNKGKKLFQSAGRNAYKPTAAAGVLFKEKWQVKPGRKAKVAEGSG
jgi:hypothetical protein